jgi:hypothetical protein
VYRTSKFVMAALFTLALLCRDPTQAAVFDSPTLLPSIPNPCSIASGDVNGDGLLDFAVSSLYAESLAVHLSNGNGTYAIVRGWGYTRDGDLSIVAANLDTFPDFAAGTGSGVYLRYGDGTGAEDWGDEVYIPGSSTESWHMAAGLFNGDTLTDFAVANYRSPGSIAVILSNGDGTYATAVDYPTLPGPQSVTAADVNGDSHLDLIVPTPGCCFQDQNAVSVFLGNPDGTFNARQDFGTPDCPLAATVNDFNGDGKQDIAVSTCLGKISVLLGAGDGTFGVNTDYAPTSFRMEAVVSEDFNGDGHADIAASCTGISDAGTVELLLNDGSGGFEPALHFPVGDAPTDLIAFDLNLDQRPDLLVASSSYIQGPGGLYALVNCGPCTPTAIEVALLDARADESGVHIRWNVHEPDGSTATLERRTRGEDWAVRAQLLIIGSVLEANDAEVSRGERYAYRLTIHSPEGDITTPEFWVDAAGEAAPRSLVLSQPSPNPSGGTISMRLGLPRELQADLVVFDVSGRLVARVSNSRRTAGWHDLRWDGHDQAGRPVASGTYFLRLTAGSSVTRRFVVLR